MSGRNDELREAVAREIVARVVAAWRYRENADRGWPTLKAAIYNAAILALPALRATEERARVAEADVEAGARAVYLQADPGTEDDWLGEDAEVRDYYRRISRAVLDAGGGSEWRKTCSPASPSISKTSLIPDSEAEAVASHIVFGERAFGIPEDQRDNTFLVAYSTIVKEVSKALANAEERARVAEEARDGWREAARRDLERALRAEACAAELVGALRPAVEALLTAEVLIDADYSVDEFNRIQAVRKRAAALIARAEEQTP